MVQYAKHHGLHQAGSWNLKTLNFGGYAALAMAAQVLFNWSFLALWTWCTQARSSKKQVTSPKGHHMGQVCTWPKCAGLSLQLHAPVACCPWPWLHAVHVPEGLALAQLYFSH